MINTADAAARRQRSTPRARRLGLLMDIVIVEFIALLSVWAPTCFAAPSSGPPPSTHIGCGGDYTVPARLVLNGGNQASQLCTWNLLPSNSDGIILDYQRTDVGPCVWDSEGFPTNYVLLWTGATMLGPYCGGELPPVVVFVGKIAIIVKMEPRLLSSIVFEVIAQPPSISTPPSCTIKAALDAMRGCNPFNSYLNSSIVGNASSFGTYQLPSGPTVTSSVTDLRRLFDIQGRLSAGLYQRFTTAYEWAPFVVGPLDQSAVVCALGITLVGPTYEYFVTRITDSLTIDYAGIVNRNATEEVCSIDTVQTDGYKIYACRQPRRGSWVVMQSYCVGCILDLREVLIFTTSSLTDLSIPEW